MYKNNTNQMLGNIRGRGRQISERIQRSGSPNCLQNMEGKINNHIPRVRYIERKKGKNVCGTYETC